MQKSELEILREISKGLKKAIELLKHELRKWHGISIPDESKEFCWQFFSQKSSIMQKAFNAVFQYTVYESMVKQGIEINEKTFPNLKKFFELTEKGENENEKDSL